ncbi:histone-like nucleoid-structuring protein Lsr2 [Puerhibacterium puerhi]|uniref:histone-like nucleoid-structuring protein Lsr2 n=1 Tax=Puerhibacterium puerhi TaxID=2692623 RepID=UPI00135877B8|nr:Lsr2 family protein [Puerhibacterium puerhi]
MAQKVVTSILDDIDGSDAAETVRFALDGKAYEIDLSAAHAKKFRKSLDPYVKAARKVRKTRGRNGRG